MQWVRAFVVPSFEIVQSFELGQQGITKRRGSDGLRQTISVKRTNSATIRVMNGTASEGRHECPESGLKDEQRVLGCRMIEFAIVGR
jgi:hypothetical protein